MSENSSEGDEGSQVGISDDKLPEDLRPSDDNPLAKELDDAGTAGDLEPGELVCFQTSTSTTGSAERAQPGRSSVKIVSPLEDRTVRRPSMRSASSEAMANPRPEP